MSDSSIANLLVSINGKRSTSKVSVKQLKVKIGNLRNLLSGNLLRKGATKALATVKAAQLKATLDAKLAKIQS